MKTAILLLVLLLAFNAAWGQYTYPDRLYSYESGWDGITAGGYAYSSGMYGADTSQWVIWLDRDGLDPDADDMDIYVEVDTLLGVATDTTTFSLYAYPIIYSITAAKLFEGKVWTGQVMWEYPLALTRRGTGTSSVSFAATADSMYVFHSSTWWEDQLVLGVLLRATTTATDSFYFEDVLASYLKP